MTTTHVFIVDTNTFKYHLEYLFAGTGAKDNSNDNTRNKRVNIFKKEIKAGKLKFGASNNAEIQKLYDSYQKKKIILFYEFKKNKKKIYFYPLTN